MTEQHEVVPGEGSVTIETTTITVTSIDGETLIRMFEGAARMLEEKVPHINALNVFPVPDGDTGTNMMLTVQSAVTELRKGSDTTRPVGEVASRFARGALMGARGNSGVILSQILSGLAKGLEGRQVATAADMVEALHHARERAYKAVMQPVEGTILTVMREAADAAHDHFESEEETTLLSLLTTTVNAAREAERRTPELLPVLKEAGVTDSGGHGLMVMLEGLLRRFKGEELGELTTSFSSAEVDPETTGHPTMGEALEGDWGYDIQYLITARQGQPMDIDAIRAHIESIGDCPLVVGDESLIKVHVHCPNPGPAITFGAEHGSISDVVVEDMDMQAEEFLGEEESPASVTRTDEVTGIGIVAVAPGDGLAEVLLSLGVSKVVAGGQTMNPSTKDLLEAVESVSADTVFLLPNNKNIIMAAQQVPELSEKTVHIVPTRTVPQGVAAVMAFNYGGEAEDNLAAMAEAVEHVVTGEVTNAVRTTTIDGVEVTDGDIIGILNGKLIVADTDVTRVVRAMLDRVDTDEYEIVTLFYGEPLDEAEAARIVEELEEAYPALEMDLMAGGQPHYHFIFSVE